MAKNVIILGAGASAGYGAPVMRNFLDVAAQLYASGKAGQRAESFKRVFEAVSNLQAVHSKSELDLVNIESIFTAFELAKTLQRFPGVEVASIDDLIDDLKWVIVSTLQAKLNFPVQGRTIIGHPDIRQFIRSILSRERRQGKVDTAILTFNYDLLVDLAILSEQVGVDYGLARQPNCHEWIPLLKLHGSLNWTTNIHTKEVFPWFLNKYFARYGLQVPNPDITSAGIPIGDQLSQYGEGENEPEKVDGIPVIVPPSWNKADSHRAISKVWARAAAELSEASSIFVVGYSLPDTDSFFRQLYALGTVGATLLQRFWVYNPDQKREGVFRSMLGPGARERFQFFPLDFAKAMIEIPKALKND